MKILKNVNMMSLLVSVILMVTTAGIVSADSGYGYGREYSGSSSSGTGGNGVISGELFSNIAKHQTYEKDLISGIPVVFPFAVPELAIYQVTVTGKENEFDVSIRVESLKGTSKIAKIPAPEDVYVNENVWFGSQRISDVLIKFRVKNSWIVDRTGDTQLFKYDIKNGNWIQLETKETGKDDTYTYFESKSNALSIFAISKVKDVNVTPVSRLTETPITEDTTIPGPIGTTKAPGFDMVITIISVSAIYIFRRRL